MFRAIIGFLLLFWLLGIIFRIAGALIHLLLLVAIIMLLVKFIRKIS